MEQCNIDDLPPEGSPAYVSEATAGHAVIYRQWLTNDDQPENVRTIDVQSFIDHVTKSSLTSTNRQNDDAVDGEVSKTVGELAPLPGKTCLHDAVELTNDDAMAAAECMRQFSEMDKSLSSAKDSVLDVSGIKKLFVDAVAPFPVGHFHYGPLPVRADASALHVAAYRGKAKTIRALCAAGADVDAMSVVHGRSTYHHAYDYMTQHNYTEQYQHHQDGSGPISRLSLTALHWAAVIGDVDVVHALLDCGATIDAQREDGVTPLYTAARFDQLEVVDALLSRGADVDAARSNASTPLFAAVERGLDRIVRRLIAAGADVNIPGPHGYMPLHVAACYGLATTVYALIAESGGMAHIDARSAETADCALHMAVVQGHRRVVAVLLACGADVNARRMDGSTVLHDACSAGDIRLVQLLLSMGADVNVRCDAGSTAAQQAIKSGHKEVIELLVAHGANLSDVVYSSAGDGRSTTLLHEAVRNNRVEIVRLLIQKGALKSVDSSNVEDIGSSDRTSSSTSSPAAVVEDETPLYIAAKYNRIEIVQLLLDRRVDVDARPVATAEHVGSGGLLFTPLYAATVEGNIEVVRLLLAAGADVRVPCGPDGGTALHAAVFDGQREMVKLLLDALVGASGGDVDQRANSTGETALHVAARFGNVDAASLLLERGANMDAPANDQSTPRSVAIRYQRSDILQTYFDWNASSAAAAAAAAAVAAVVH